MANGSSGYTWMIRSGFEDEVLWVNTLEGNVRLEELFETAFTWYQHPEFSPETPVLWDLRNAFLDFSMAELLTQHRPSIDRVNRERPNGKTAWLVSSSIAAVIVQEVITTVLWAADWRVFDGTPESARAWLTENGDGGS